MKISNIGASQWNILPKEQVNKAGMSKELPTLTKEAIQPSDTALMKIDHSINRGIHVDIYA